MVWPTQSFPSGSIYGESNVYLTLKNFTAMGVIQYYTLDMKDVDAAVHKTTVKETTAMNVTTKLPWRFICLAGVYTGTT